MRKVILYISISLDGYIADNNGCVSWLNALPVNQGSKDTFEDLYNSVDTVIMGNNTYKQISTELNNNEWIYSNKTCFVYSNSMAGQTDQIIYTNKNPTSLIKEILNAKGKNICIIGGGALVASFLENDLIDMYIISIIPIIIGSGIPIFENGIPFNKLKLVSNKTIGNVVELKYLVDKSDKLVTTCTIYS